MKPLDFVMVKAKSRKETVTTITPTNIDVSRVEVPYPFNIGMVTEVSNDGRCSVTWLIKGTTMKNSWWGEEELEIGRAHV